MAAPCVAALRSALTGVRLGCGRSPALPPPARIHLSSAAPTSRTETRSSAGGRREQEEEEEGPEYIPSRKAKNPMMKIGYAWMIGLPTGIIGFLLAKRQVDKNRLKQLKIRQRMRQTNEGQYEGSRYRHKADGVKLER